MILQPYHSMRTGVREVRLERTDERGRRKGGPLPSSWPLLGPMERLHCLRRLHVTVKTRCLHQERARPVNSPNSMVLDPIPKVGSALGEDRFGFG